MKIGHYEFWAKIGLEQALPKKQEIAHDHKQDNFDKKNIFYNQNYLYNFYSMTIFWFSRISRTL